VKGLVVDASGRFLLAREDNGKWEFPGGGLDHDEEPLDGLRREIQEETGLEVTWVSPSPIYFTTSKRLHYENYIANVFYEIKLKDLNFTPSEECQELRFFTVEEAKQQDLFPNVTEFLKVFDPALHN
jgi:8-oxo-dGTP pyrophosphatase MutT (NUDIX family)